MMGIAFNSRGHLPAPIRLAEARRAEVPIFTGLVILLGIAATVAGASLLLSGAVSLGEGGKDAALNHPASSLPPLKILQVTSQSTPEGDVTILETVTLASGFQEYDLRTLDLSLETSGRTVRLAYGAEAGPATYAATVQRDTDGSFSTLRPLLTTGDLAQITIRLPADALPLAEARGLVQGQVSQGTLAGPPDALQTATDAQGRPLVRLPMAF